jgi:prepilin-type N-terminal cleavage/methylation domain-containing protein
MKRGASTRNVHQGFTLVETLVVLAVTGILFVVFAGSWLGKQHASEFQTSSQDLRARLQQMLSDVQNGFYSGDNIGCNYGPSLNTTGTRGGSNACIFLGKIVQLKALGTDPETNVVYGVVGNRTDVSGTVLVGSVAAANPSFMFNTGDPANSGLGIDPTEKFNSEYGLSFLGAKITGGTYLAASNAIAVGFLSPPSPDTDLSGSFVSGAQQYDLYGLHATPGGSLKATARNLQTVLRSTTPAQSVLLCFKSGGTDKYAVVTFSESGNSLNANLKVQSSPCV